MNIFFTPCKKKTYTASVLTLSGCLASWGCFFGYEWHYCELIGQLGGSLHIAQFTKFYIVRFTTVLYSTFHSSFMVYFWRSVTGSHHSRYFFIPHLWLFSIFKLHQVSSEAILWHRSGSTLPRVAWCLTAPMFDLNELWPSARSRTFITG